MRFKIRRTSDYSGEHKPCDQAKRAKIAKYERRTVKTPEEFDAKFGESEGPWLAGAIEHGTYEGGIWRRTADVDTWVLDYESLEELLSLAESYGEIVLSPGFRDEPMTLEIYDDYRE